MARVVKDSGQSRPALAEEVKSCFRFSLPCESAGGTTFKIFRDPIGPVILDKVADSLLRAGFRAARPKPGKACDAAFSVSFDRFNVVVVFGAKRRPGQISCFVLTWIDKGRHSLAPFAESEWARVCDAIEEAVKQYPGIDSFERLTRTESNQRGDF
jgi:hypothetical protein